MIKTIDFMRACLQNRNIPLSWGISNIQVSNDDVVFTVCGSKIQTSVVVNGTGDDITISIDGIIKVFSDENAALKWLDEKIE